MQSDRGVFLFWKTPLLRIVGIALLALSLGLLVGPVWGWALACLAYAGLTMVHLCYLFRLARWLEAPQVEDIPEGWGAWRTVFGVLYRAYRQREREQAQLANAMSWFRQTAEAIPDGIVILSAENRLEWFNPQAEVHLGLQRGRDQGIVLDQLVRQPGFAEFLIHAPFGEAFILRSAQVGGSVVSLQLVPFEGKHRLLLSRDITQFEKIERMRRDFIANVSHELRTPLTVIGGFLETLLDTPDINPASLRHYQEMLYQQSQRMQRLVDDLLLLSQLENQPQQNTEEVIDFSKLWPQLLRDTEVLSQGKHDIAAEIAPIFLKGNEHELRSAFSNLLSNAVRYTPAGGKITVFWGVEGSQGVFRVTDTGVGIAPEHIPRLTERFYRVDRSRSRETGGTGLGLAIVKHILTHHRATLEIASVPGQGSTFTAIFPENRLVFQERTD